jgi:hypothetical protein
MGYFVYGGWNHMIQRRMSTRAAIAAITAVMALSLTTVSANASTSTGAVTTAIQVVRTAGSATGDIAPAFLGHPKAWGMVALKVNPNSTTVGPRKVENVGGGTWVYGSPLARRSRSLLP